MSLDFRKAGTTPPSCRPHLERLEVREVLYAVSGNAWPHPERVTLSFVPDGTDVGGVASNLFSAFNARFGSTAVWQKEIVRAAQLWAQQANLNFSVVSDNGAALGSGAYQQGDPGFGDIRIGGYAFGTSTLAQAYLPPSVNNYSVAGDLQFNTAQTWNLGSTYDLFTVAVHEIGHALGLDHSTVGSANLYPSYNGTRAGLTSDDISGIRANYSGARTIDAYDATGTNSSVSTADDLTAMLNPVSKAALISDLDITTTNDVDFYKIVVPAGSASIFQVRAQSAGLSLLNIKMSVLASNGSTVLASASSGGLNGATICIGVGTVTAGQVLYVKVQGMDSTAMSTGEYALSLNLGTGTTPTPSIPNTRTLNGSILSNGGGQLALANRQGGKAVESNNLGDSNTVATLTNEYGIYEALSAGDAFAPPSSRAGIQAQAFDQPAGRANHHEVAFLTWTDRFADLSPSPGTAADDSVAPPDDSHLHASVDAGIRNMSDGLGLVEHLFVAPPTTYQRPSMLTVCAPRLLGFTDWASTPTDALL